MIADSIFLVSILGFPLGVWSAKQALDEVKRYKKYIMPLTLFCAVLTLALIILQERVSASATLFLAWFFFGIHKHKISKKFTKK